MSTCRARRWSCRMLAAAVVAMPYAPAFADGGIDTPQCKEAVSKILEATGAKFDHASPSGDNVFLSHRATRSFSMSCLPGQPPNVFASAGQAFPSNDYFALLAEAGAAVTKVPRAELEREIRSCQRAALKSSDEQEETHRPHVQIDCQAFVRDGGGASITVAPEEPE